MTTRGGGVSLFRLEEEDREWGNGDAEGVAVLLVRHGRRLGGAEVADAAAAVERGVAVEQLAPPSAARHAEPVVVACHRREVAHHRDRRRVVAALAKERQHALLPVAALDPLEAVDGEILAM